MTVFCDYLSVTYHPERHPAGAVRLFLASLGSNPVNDSLYRVGDGGTVTVGIQYGSMRVSASGAALEHFRERGVFMDYLALLAEWPHRVTLLDAARDYDCDAAPIVASLQRRYRRRKVFLGRKGLEWRALVSERPSDGARTGTFYVGDRTKARATAKVYDKQEEVRVRHGRLIHPRTRYEVRVKKDYGATLRDAAEPERLFWHVAAPALLDKPDGVEDWDPDWSQGWSAGPRPELLPAEVLARRVSSSAEVELLASIADEMGPGGRVWLLRRLAERLGVQVEGKVSLAALGAPEAAEGP